MQNYKQDFFGRGLLCLVWLATCCETKPKVFVISRQSGFPPPSAQAKEVSHFLDTLLALNPTGHAIPLGSPLYVTINWQPFPPITLRKKN